MVGTADRLVAGRKRAQISSVLLAALGGFILTSLATHSNFDAPNSSQIRMESFNWGGQIGAHLSYALLTTVGYAGYVIPALCFLWSWNRWRNCPVRVGVMRSLGLMGSAFFVSVAAGLPTYSRYTAFEIGGWFGTELTSQLLIPYAGRMGSCILLIGLLTASIMVGTDLERRHFYVTGAAIGRMIKLFAIQTWGQITCSLRAIYRWICVQKPIFASSKSKNQPSLESAPLFNTKSNGDSKSVQSPPSSIGKASQAAPLRIETPPLPIVKSQSTQEGDDNHCQSKTKTANDVTGQLSNTTSNKSISSGNTVSKSGGPYKIPTIELLDPIPNVRQDMERTELLQNAKVLEDAMGNFDVTGRVIEVSPGPVVTRYEIEPAPGVKVNRIVTLSDDLARVMSAKGIRIQAPVPGRSVVGVEIANQKQDIVYLKEIVESREFAKCDATLPIALGKTISGEPHIADLAKMPHLLVAGATGSGKSVCINTLISSILFKATPDQVRLLMIDPKVVELTIYNDIPHLLVPVVTEPKKASEALKWAVAEMESRYQLLAKLSVRNLADYNRKVENLDKTVVDFEDQPKSLPYIVIVVDEFADLMLTAPSDVETSLMSLAQKSRAVGIHIILATQRPSVNVITGVIKANFPSRIAFQVASKIDSRTILDMNGAERLLGKGDMLFLPGGQGEPIRIHGAFISGDETERLVAAIKSCEYKAEEVEVFFGRSDFNADVEDRDELFEDAVQTVIEHQQASTSFLQRRMKIGYSRAARLMDELEVAGIVGPAEGAKSRQILIEDQGISVADAAAALDEKEFAN